MRSVSRNLSAESNDEMRPYFPLLAIHFWSWNIGVRMTPIENASLIVNIVPVAMPFVIWFMLREHITPAEILGTIVALAGTVLLAAADYHVDRDYFLGDLVCFPSIDRGTKKVVDPSRSLASK